MKIGKLLGRMALGLGAALFALGVQAAADPAPVKAPPIKPVEEKKCYSCHDNVEEWHTEGRHATVNCAHCHDAVEHLKTAKNKEMGTRPVTNTDHRACATCHVEQYNTFVQTNYASKAKVEKASFKSRSPLFDKLMEGYGFTREHNEPRSHAFMLVDQWIVDRGFSGRFKLKDWTYVNKAEMAANNSWDIMVDRDPATNDPKKKFLAQTVSAVNPVCVNCKTQDHILDWKYMGDPDPNAKWARTSNPVDFVKAMKHPLNCYMCHDPHSAKPRVVRDALIQAVVDRKEGTYPMDPVKSQQTKMEKVVFQRGGKDFRAIGLLSKADSNLMCAQCHVEYNCGAGFDCSDPAKPNYITMADPRTNLFTWVNVFGYKEKMVGQYKFKDFKHASTGALLPKIQHPEMETYWGSMHERAGVECKDCHMTKKKHANGKVTTNHQQMSPRYNVKAACMGCHKDYSEEEAMYQIESVQGYIRGKMTKAEFWLAQLIDVIVQAKEAGVAKDIIDQALDKQYDANLYWEWWTAENSDGFHNPEAARDSLTRSIDASQAGMKLLKEAMAGMKTAAK